MARGYSQSRSESGPYGDAGYRSREAARSGGDSGITMRVIRRELNEYYGQEPSDFVDTAKDLRNIPTQQGVLDSFNRAVDNIQLNPYRPFTNIVDRDVNDESTANLSMFVAYRDLLAEQGKSKQEIAQLDEAIENYAEEAAQLMFALQYAEENERIGASIIERYNKSALKAKDTFQDIILPSKKEPRNQ